MNYTHHHHHMHDAPVHENPRHEGCMQMTFSSLADYQLKLLFSWWDISDRYSFNVTWCIVFSSVIGMHAIKYYLSLVESKLSSSKKENGAENSSFTPAYTVDDKKTFPVYVPSNQHQLRLFHALLSGVLYAVSLLLMLVAMTYNTALFVALILGYVAGDYLFFHQIETKGGVASSNDCH